MSLPDSLATGPGRTVVAGAPEGADTLALAQIVRRSGGPVLAVMRDEGRMRQAAARLSFVDPDLEMILLPAWDCLPYDRVSPNAESVAGRLDALSELAAGIDGRMVVVLTTVASVLQKVPPVQSFQESTLTVDKGERCAVETLQTFFERNGYRRANTVREPGEYAVRGGILDVFPPGEPDPLRLDFFGDELESIRRFDAMSQRTLGQADSLILRPVSEIMLDREHIDRFRQSYRQLFGGDATGDPLFEAVSEGRRAPGVEHWLPLFHDHMECIPDWMPEDSPIVLDIQADEAIAARLETVQDHYAARKDEEAIRQKRRRTDDDGPPPYKPIAPEMLYFTAKEWSERIALSRVFALNAYPLPDVGSEGGVEFGARRIPDFAAARKSPDVDLFEAVAERVKTTDQRRSLIAASGEGARERLKLLLRDGGLTDLADVRSWSELDGVPMGKAAIGVLPVDAGFETDDIQVISEPDILGERLSRPARRRRRGEEFITELSAIETGDLVVHVEHGIARYDGLETLTVDGAPHDCLRLVYSGDDRLYLPVENLEVLSRYGSEEAGVQLDKLGGVAWQARKAKLKQRVREIAESLMKIAAERALRKGEPVVPQQGAYDEFCARFAFSETEDQLKAIEDVFTDLASGKPMDRLVCGDVGFGKTEVALRAAFAVAMTGKQVAVVVPTTLLARQHFRIFEERFQGLPVRVRQLSRLVTGKAAEEVKAGLADGTVDIVVGTHALLAKSVKVRDLGLLIVDEEQHFGVQQKERLKQLRANVHVLTLTATPIPRTLQMALAGVREMSIIASPPVDRLAVRTFVLPYDPVVLREAIRRERYRGGQIFYVCPRVSDLDRVRERIRELTPNSSVAVAHGRMGARELETVMTDFVAGKYDVLLATNIVESGLDIPNANTMIIHRSDMFGLAQLYQLRGRIGRGKQRAYCYLTLPPGKVLTETARKRLDVMQTLDSLGAGFTLASHDLDIRGAGNLVGEEQSGHIKEVGVELYQRMLEEAVAAARDHVAAEEIEETWTPTINVGIAVLIPEKYVPDLSVRLGLYRRLSDLKSAKEIDQFAVEVVDRFGPMPEEVENLMAVVAIKQACKAAGIEKVDAGPKGALISFRNDAFSNPAGLIGFIQRMAGTTKLRPDHKLVIMRPWTDSKRRLKGVRKVAEALAKVAG
ncbi:MAG: transcription-repair coupling factor [Alphaproteobacteria bacterium]|nr:transcription-repair coupling factor [Alphaproteobacteria bacterium]